MLLYMQKKSKRGAQAYEAVGREAWEVSWLVNHFVSHL